MSLRRRLLLTLGASLCVLWLAAAGWLLIDLQRSVRDTLDQRLVSSARMVAGLLGNVPRSAWRQAIGPALASPPTPNVACQIRSMRGKVLLRTRGDLGTQLGQAPPGFSEIERNGQRWRLYTDVAHGLMITVADRLDERRRLQLGIVLAAALPFVLALIGSLVVVWWSIRRGLAPLERLRAELASRDPATLTPIVVADAPAELRPAIATLNRLLARTDDALAREQRFTSNAAHELRTPLTAIKTHVQLASRLEGRRAKAALADAEAGIARLHHTLEQLLLLTRIEETGAAGGESARVRDTAAAALADLANLANLAEAGRVCTPLTMPDTWIAAPLALAAGAIRNLLENAIRHSPPGASIELAIERERRGVVFIVRDRGDWPADADPETLIPRFSRRSAEHDGSGLGLAIVAAVAERFGGRLVLAAREGGGLFARLYLPAADNDERVAASREM
ncbi:sensor histidine kinase [Salinisphaera sp.]|uniref:sensor histidine kinase n=1 Tax=Salinisphaera sp. TaxID=1914330 RepID=UPI002D764AC4|nr:ATP-binding protein [Salinisphaera sp.]HET7313194.1 ATP-binding protein [Salinisphaera sp.]